MNKFPISWFEGMPIGATNFQYNFLYTEWKNSYLLNNINHYFWGIIKLEWEESYISSGILKIKLLEGILPDATPVVISQKENLSINLNEYKEALKDEDLTIYINLPNNHYVKQSNLNNTRYKDETIQVTDLNDKNEIANISILVPEYRLTLEKNSSLDNISIPLAMINFNGLNFQFTKYAPPTLKISNNTILISQLKELVEQGRGKLKYLINKSNLSIEDQMKIICLSNIVLNIENAILNDISSYSLHILLIQNLSYAFALLKPQNFPIIEAYNHLDYMKNMKILLEFMQSAINKVIENYKQRKFTREGHAFAIDLLNKNRIIIGLQKDSNSSYNELENWIKNAIIGTEDRLDSIKDERSIGAARKIIPSMEEIQNNDNIIFIEIENNANYLSENKLFCILGNDSYIPPLVAYLFEPKK